MGGSAWRCVLLLVTGCGESRPPAESEAESEAEAESGSEAESESESEAESESEPQPGCVPGAWTRETIPTAGSVWSNALAVTASGDVNVAYWQNGFKYALREMGGDWVEESIDVVKVPLEGSPLDIALDADGTPGVLYSGSDPGDAEEVRYAHREAENDWAIETIAALPFTDQVSLAIDGMGVVHAAYLRISVELYYARRDGGVWTIEEVLGPCPAISGPCFALGADADGVYMAIRGFDGGLELASRWNLADSFWGENQLDPDDGAGWYPALDVATAGVHVSYFEHDSGALRYAYQQMEEPWDLTIENVIDGVAFADYGNGSSIAVDADGDVHIAYYDATDGGKLGYARRSATGSFAVETIDDEDDAGWFPSIDLDATGAAHLTYVVFSETDGTALKYARRCP